MIILDSTGKSLEVVLAGAVTANQLPIVTAYVDVTTTTYVPAASDTVTNNTTAVTVVAAPGASTQRQVKLASVFNADTATATATVRLNNGGTFRTLVKVALAVGSTLLYTDGEGWRVLDSTGAIVSGGGGTPAAHHASHENGGSDEISVAGLSGVLADPQPPIIGAGATQAVAGNDARLTDARTPTAHATSHKSGGSDAIKLDELAAPTDIATLNASTTAHGLLKKLSNTASDYLDGQGNWSSMAWVDVAYASGNFSGGAGTWTVDSGDQAAFRYIKVGRLCVMVITLNTTSISGTVNPAAITSPVTAATLTTGLGVLYDNSASVQTTCVWQISLTSISVYKIDQTAWAASTNNTYLRLILVFPW